MNNISDVYLEELKKKYHGKKLDIALNKVKKGYPIQYLIGDVNFYGNKINVNKAVLIPRYETEFLVDLILNKLINEKKYKILDIGTGSGCIAISIAKRLTNSQVVGIDVSKKALRVANKNKKMNMVNNLDFKKLNVFKCLNFNDYSVIVSNPPYVSYNEKVGLETKYEPQNAIFADNNGLIFYEEIIKKVSTSKNVEHIFFEIGMYQAKPIEKFKNEYLSEYKFEKIKDLSGKDRYIHIYLNNK